MDDPLASFLKVIVVCFESEREGENPSIPGMDMSATCKADRKYSMDEESLSLHDINLVGGTNYTPHSLCILSFSLSLTS